MVAHERTRSHIIFRSCSIFWLCMSFRLRVKSMETPIWAFIFCVRSNKPDARYPPRMAYTAGRRHHVYSQSEIYDIGTEILLLTKNDHNSTQKAPKSIIPGRIKKITTFPIIWQCQIKIWSTFQKVTSLDWQALFLWIFAPPHGRRQTRTKH